MAKKPLFPKRQARTPSGTERTINWILIVLLALVVGTFAWSGTWPGPPGLPETEAAPPATLPVATPGGWPRGAIESYDESTLYEKINGKADAYLAFHFEVLEFAGYTDPARPEVFVDVYLYGFETAVDAFGMYRSQRPSTAPIPATGGELGVSAGESGASGAALFGWKGPRYLEVVASGPEAAAEAQALADRIREALSEADALAFPAGLLEDDVQRAGFERSGALGVEGLVDAWTAVYEDGTKAAVATLPSNEAAARAAAEALETFEFLGAPAVFEAVEARVLGVVDAPTPERAKAVLARLRAGLEDAR